MVTQTHTPEKEFTNCHFIEGDNINELVTYCLARIRERSKEFYRKELLKNLETNGESIIDQHAGMGQFYTVKLIAN